MTALSTGSRTKTSSSLARPDKAIEALEHALTEVGRAMLRMPVPPEALAEGEHVDRSGYWALVRLDEAGGPVRLSDLATALELDLSTVSRQARHLVDTGLVDRHADPDDGRAALLSLSRRGCQVLQAVRSARRDVLARTLAGWSAADRQALAAAVSRLADDVQGTVGR
jgi:DNA-binding MarR family transcriptional regulator